MAAYSKISKLKTPSRIFSDQGQISKNWKICSEGILLASLCPNFRILSWKINILSINNEKHFLVFWHSFNVEIWCQLHWIVFTKRWILKKDGRGPTNSNEDVVFFVTDIMVNLINIFASLRNYYKVKEFLYRWIFFRFILITE